uniref:Uncharacterized protein n=1 Tax=Romanomermis culicivorax TaxID=13658 RepID=A0A915HGF4_ROMCU
MAGDMKNFQFAVPMPANSTASSYPRYIQLVFPNGTMFVFETFTATPEDWTALFSLVDGEHTIIVSFDGAEDWVGIYALLGTHFWMDHQKKNKDPLLKAIHLDAYHVIRNIDIFPPLYELARRIGFFPEKRTLKATISAMWVGAGRFKTDAMIPHRFGILQQPGDIISTIRHSRVGGPRCLLPTFIVFGFRPLWLHPQKIQRSSVVSP